MYHTQQHMYHNLQVVMTWLVDKQRAMKVVSDRQGLVDFAIGLVIFALNLPDGQVLFFWEIQITKGFGASWNDLWPSTC